MNAAPKRLQMLKKKTIFKKFTAGLTATKSTQSGPSGSSHHIWFPNMLGGTHPFVLASALQLLIAVLDDLCWDIGPDVILLTAAFWSGCDARNRHGGTRSVMDEIRGWGNAGCTTTGVEVAVFSILGSPVRVTVITGAEG